jgi:hypothetical protein
VSRRAAGAAAAAILAAVAACHGAERRPDAPAVLVDPGEETRAALLAAVSSALDGVPATLAEDALTGSSDLVVERVRPRDAGGTPLDGRDRGGPERFRLVASGGHCVLVHERTGARTALAGARCATQDGR